MRARLSARYVTYYPSPYLKDIISISISLQCIGRLLFTPSTQPLLRPYLEKIMSVCLTEMSNEDETVKDKDKKAFMGFLEPVAVQLGGAKMKVSRSCRATQG